MSFDDEQDDEEPTTEIALVSDAPEEGDVPEISKKILTWMPRRASLRRRSPCVPISSLRRRSTICVRR